jgi:diguanylate cyclase (GGDEF)-like protein
MNMSMAASKILAGELSPAMDSESQTKPPGSSSPFRFFLALMGSGTVVTVGVMYAMTELPKSTPLANVFIGSGLEVLIMAVPVYFFLLRPMSQYISQREIIARNLEHANSQLEERVRERTADLGKVSRDLQRSLQTLEETHRESTILGELIELLQASRTAAEAEDMLWRFGQKLFPTESGAVYLFRSSRNVLERAASWGSQTLDTFKPEECWGLRRGRLYMSQDDGWHPLCKHLQALPEKSASLCVPMMAQGDATGVLVLNSNRQPSDGVAISDQAKRLAPVAGEQIALALANLQLREKLRDQAIRDPLTSMFNRRYFEETADRELRRAEQSGAGAGVVMIDIDHFKRLNDTRGHEAGDAALRRIGLLLQTKTRIEDIACRYGGEEFLLLLSGVSAESLTSRANEIREAVKEMEMRFHGDILPSITISCGVAVFPDHGRSCNELAEAADRALYVAKQEGRDRVVLAS